MVQAGSLVLQGTASDPVVSHVGVTLTSLTDANGKIMAAGQLSTRFARLDQKAWLRLNGPPPGGELTANAQVRNTDLAGLLPVVVTGQSTLELLATSLRSSSKAQGLIIGAATGSETARLTAHGCNFLQLSTAILLAHVDQTPGAQDLSHNYFNKVSQILSTTDDLETGVSQVLLGPVDPLFSPTLVRLVEDDLTTTKEHINLDSLLPLEVSGVGSDDATVNHLLLRLRAHDSNPEGQYFYLQETAPDSNLYRPLELNVTSTGQPGLNTLVAALYEVVTVEDLKGEVLLEARVVDHCDDQDPCTLNLWVDGACSFVPSDDLDCSKGRICEGQFQCQAGACVKVGPPPVCEGAKQCVKEGVCDPYKGCVYPLEAPGTPCDADGNGCTMNDKCYQGLCVVGPKANCATPQSPCLGQVCVNVAANEYFCQPDLPSMDGQVCKVPGSDPPHPGVCDNGQCIPDDLSCKVHPDCCPEGQRLEDGLPCDDLDPCTGDDLCTKGVCGGQPLTCDDFLGCTKDLCLPGFGCVFAPVHTDCPDTGICRAGLCDPDTGCSTQAAPDWTDCGTPDDLQACFGGACKDFLPENRCESPATLELGVTRFFPVAGLHQYFGDPPGFELLHPIREFFIQVPVDLPAGATLLLSPDPGVDLAQAAWDTCQDQTPFSGYIDSKGPGALEYMGFGGELLPGSIVEVLILEWPNEEARISMLLMNPPDDGDTISGADASPLDDATGGGGGGGGGGCTVGPRATPTPLLLLLLLLLVRKVAMGSGPYTLHSPRPLPPRRP
jgi:hypothetical protein